MPRIQVMDDRGLHHIAADFHAWVPGEYDFPDDPAYAKWLQGHVDSGKAKLVEDASGPPAGPNEEPPEPTNTPDNAQGQGVVSTAGGDEQEPNQEPNQEPAAPTAEGAPQPLEDLGSSPAVDEAAPVESQLAVEQDALLPGTAVVEPPQEPATGRGRGRSRGGD